MELLAPAGTEAAFLAALHTGADAIYLGAGPHHARQAAGGFTESVFFSLVEEAHAAGVRVYLTLNTLLGDQETPLAASWAEQAWQGGVDAIIVQDIGLARKLRRLNPEMVLHASTQMSLHNVEGVLAARQAGLSRVVLARELSLSTISAIHAATDTELEVFGHGALCVSYSGQCLMSSLIGGRSGNRGMCAQPCRLPWKLRNASGDETTSGYLLSMKDLMTLSLLPQLQAAGVTALKIEGRMKSPEYVALVTDIYRRHLDRLASDGADNYYMDEQDERTLLQIFNRGGFTRRYLMGTKPPVADALVDSSHPKHRGVRIGTVVAWRAPYATVSLSEPVALGDGLEIHGSGRGGEAAVSMLLTAIVNAQGHDKTAKAGETVQLGDVREEVREGDPVFRTSQKELMQAAAEKMSHWQVHRVPVRMDFQLKSGELAILEVSDDQGHLVSIPSGMPAEAARERPLSAERLVEQLQKTGDTFWLPRMGTLSLDGVGTLPVRAINAMRREALDTLGAHRIADTKRLTAGLQGNSVDTLVREPLPVGSEVLNVSFAHKPSPEWLALSGLDAWAGRIRLFLPPVSLEEVLAILAEFSGAIWIRTPFILPQERMDALLKRVLLLLPHIAGLAAGNPGTLRRLRELAPQVPILADYGMNLWNGDAIRQAADWGADMALLSPELPPEAAASLAETAIPFVDWAYGRIQVMTMAHCPGAMAGACDGHCARCSRQKGILTDRAGAGFPYFRDPLAETTNVFHHRPIKRSSSLWHPQAAGLQMLVTDEDPAAMGAMFRAVMAEIALRGK